MTSWFDLIPSFVVALAAFLGLIIFAMHRLTTRLIGLALACAIAWASIDSFFLSFGILKTSVGSFDLPLGGQTSGMCLLLLAILLLIRRMFQGRRGFERIFVLSCGVTVLLTNLLFHFVLFEVLGRQWVHDSLDVSEVPLSQSIELMPATCTSVLLICTISTLEGAERYSESGTLFILRTRDRVILEGARGLYPLTKPFHEGRQNYLAAYHVKEGQLVELKNTISSGAITQVINLSLNALSFSVGFVWICGALYLTTFHRRRINDRRRLSALRG